MPDGACVIRRDGKRGVVWYIKYRDATGRQIKERLGRGADGWTNRKAAAALRARLTDVAREGYRRPVPMTFGSFASEWLETYPAKKQLKHSTTHGYRTIVRVHLRPVFGSSKLEALTVEAIERYVAGRHRAALGPRSINRHLNLLSLILGSAVRRGYLQSNPAGLVDRPREPRNRWRILSPAEVVAVERAYVELAAEAEDEEERAWREQARVVFVTLLGTGMRRGELLGLRWRAVALADPAGPSLRVIETVVRDRADTPKSVAGERTIALGGRVASELFEHRARSAFEGDGERVFCHPETGGTLDHKRYAETFRIALARAKVDGYIRPFHDGRHSSITNAAAAGTPPAALMARAGHSDFATTKQYIDLSGEMFREEADRLEARLWGTTGTNYRYEEADPSSGETTERAPERLLR